MAEIKIPSSYIAALVPVAAAINFIGGTIVNMLRLPVFLDMIGTALIAFTLGPWWGAITGILTNVAIALFVNPVYLPFAACNVVGALVWGYGIKFFGKNFPRFFILNVITAFLVTCMAVPIYVFVFGGATGHFADIMTAVYLSMGAQLWTAVFSSNILSSLADKILAGFLALAILETLPTHLRAGIPVMAEPLTKRVIWLIIGLVIGVAIAAGYVIMTPPT